MKKVSKIASLLSSALLLTFSVCLPLLSCSSDSSDSGGSSTGTKTTSESDGTTTLKIEENSTGFVSTTGSVKTTETNWIGFSGEGFIEGLAKGTSVIYAVKAESAVTDAKLAIHYANWESTNVRAAYVYVNGTLVNEDNPVSMTYTNKGNRGQTLSDRWCDTGYLTGISLKAGTNKIEIKGVPSETYSTFVPTAKDTAASLSSLVVNNDGQLANIDYLIVNGKGISAGSGSDIPSSYTLSYASENETAGSVTGNVSAGSVESDTSVTLTATANSGWKFECWTDGTTSNPYTFTLTGKKYVFAHFVPESYSAESSPVGYATLTAESKDAAYTITGGACGKTIEIANLSELETNKAALSSDTPYIVKITNAADSPITTTDNVSVVYTIGSNKTIYSENGKGRFKNVEIRVEGENVIIRNLKFGEVIAYDSYGGSGNDALSLNGATHVWVDHCELQSHLTPQDNVTGEEVKNESDSKFAKDFYDGLLDIKNGSSYITVSNCYFHDHWKAVLCASGDDSADTNTTTGSTDSDMRVTFYANYFENINSRQPLFRFGKAHLYNNYFYSPSDSSDIYQKSNCIDVRINSEVLAEGNYFSGVKNAIGLDLANGGKDSTGTASYSFTSSNVLSGCVNTPASGSSSYKPPYEYTVAEAGTNIADSAGANLTLSY